MEQTKTKIMIVDDQALIRDGLSLIVGLAAHLALVGTASNGLEAIERAGVLKPDLILMDIRMPQMTGIEATKAIKAQRPQTKILILTTFDEKDYLIQALQNGADGYLLKSAGAAEILSAIETLLKGQMLLVLEMAAKLVSHLVQTQTVPSDTQNDSQNVSQNDRHNDCGKVNQGASSQECPTNLGCEGSLLTPRELEIGKYVAQGVSNKEIAKVLYLSEGTVKNHVSNMLSKLEMKSRTQLALKMQSWLEGSA